MEVQAMKLDDLTLDVNQHIEINAEGWQHMLDAIGEDCSAKTAAQRR
jgi:hypothetical protein